MTNTPPMMLGERGRAHPADAEPQVEGRGERATGVLSDDSPGWRCAQTVARSNHQPSPTSAADSGSRLPVACRCANNPSSRAS